MFEKKHQLLFPIMVKTSSTMLPLGSLLPFVDLPLVKIDQNRRDLLFHTRDRLNNGMLDERPVLIMVLCAHCPFVKHLEEEITKLDKDFGDDIQMMKAGLIECSDIIVINKSDREGGDKILTFLGHYLIPTI